MFVTFAAMPVLSAPNHLYVVPFTLILPAHPIIDYPPRSSVYRPSH